MRTKNVKLLLISLLLSACNGGNSSSTSVNNSVSNTVSSSSTSTRIINDEDYWHATYTNPTMVFDEEGKYYTGEIADPTVVRGEDGYFYCVGTGRIMLRSEDACNWEIYNRNVINHPGWGQGLGSYGLWAPDLVKVGNKWIYYYSLSGWNNPIGIGYAVADYAGGPYTDQGKLFFGSEIGIKNCIDPQVIVDNGKVYMAVGSFQGLYLIELEKDGMACLNGIEYQNKNKVLIAGYDGAWDGSTYEGSYIIKKGGYYYYFGSAGACCDGKGSTYRVYVGRSKEITGPYIDKKGKALTQSGRSITNGELVLWAGVNEDRDVVGPGHNSILLDDTGDYWIYYHAYSSDDNFRTRHLFMDKLEWDKEGYPYVETYKPTFKVEKDGPRFLKDVITD